MKTMHSSMGAVEAKNRFFELLERVSRGGEVIITKHERPVAKLVSAAVPDEAERKRTTAELRVLSKQYSLKDLSVRELIDEGRL